MPDRCFEAAYWYAVGVVTPDYMYCSVLPEREAKAIQRAAELAFVGRFGEAEQERMKAGYHGLGLIDNGAVARESESTRDAFRKALDADEDER